MKNVLSVTLVFAISVANGQYFQQRFNEDYPKPLLRNERNNSGIKTRVNYINGNPAFFYFAGIGTSYLNKNLPSPDNNADRMRFTLLGTLGITVFANLGYEFTDPDGRAFHSAGNSIAEVKNTTGTGGFVAVGGIADNDVTGASGIAGNSDVLFTQLRTTGSVVSARTIDINKGEDVAWCIRKSVVPDQQGRPTWIVCGQSRHANFTDCFVARVRSNGSIVWCYRYNFDPTPVQGMFNTAHCIAKQLCEDPAGNIFVAGTLQDNQVPGISGLVFRLTAGGAVVWANNYEAGTDNEYHALRYTADNNLVIGGFTNFAAVAPVTHSMLITKLNSGNGAIMFQNVLQAFSNSGNTIYTSKCYDIVETPGPRYYLAGPVIRNNAINQMMYRTGAGGLPVNWYSYNPMQYSVGFGLDTAQTGNGPGLAYFSSMTNTEKPTFSDSHIMKTDFSGKTCKFCTAKPPKYIPMNQQIHQRPYQKFAAGTPHRLDSVTYKYDNILICNDDQIHCTDVITSRPEVQPAETLKNGNLVISPNPVTGVLHVQLNSLPAGTYQLSLTDMNGKLVSKKSSGYTEGSAKADLDMAGFASGVYLLSVKGEMVSLQQKVVKQ